MILADNGSDWFISGAPHDGYVLLRAPCCCGARGHCLTIHMPHECPQAPTAPVGAALLYYLPTLCGLSTIHFDAHRGAFCSVRCWLVGVCRWDDEGDLATLKRVPGSAFEVVDTSRYRVG
jgi:hypothetical protein